MVALGPFWAEAGVESCIGNSERVAASADPNLRALTAFWQVRLRVLEFGSGLLLSRGDLRPGNVLCEFGGVLGRATGGFYRGYD